MKKNLLSPESKSYHSLQQKPLRFFFALVLVSVFGVTTKTYGQCATFYQAFESFGGSITGNTGGAGLVQGTTPVTNLWTINGYNIGAAVDAYSGGTAARMTPALTSYIITPKITTLKDFSFWYRRTGLPGGTTSTIAVEYSTNYTGAFANVGTATWVPVTTVVAPSAGTYTQYSNTFNMTNVYIRVKWSAGASCVIDDLGWTSGTDSDNTTIVLTKGSGSCTTPALLSNVAYNFYDNGGATDSYSVSQDQTVTFTPANGERIKLQFVSNTSGTATETFTFSSPTFPNLLPAWTSTSGSLVPSASPYYSDYCETATVRYQTATGGLQAGFRITVTSDPAAACSGAVSSPTVPAATISYNAVNITWGALSGCTSPIGYDYYISTSSTPPGAGALPASSGTTLQTGYVVNSGAGATGASVTGLAGSTVYYGWVRRNCTATYGSWTAITNTGGNFTTLCSPIPVTTVSPYVEDFQASAVALPACTSTNSVSTGINTVSGNNYFFNTTTGTFIFSKPLTLDPTKIYRLSFDYGNSSNQATVIEAYYGKSNYAVSSSVTNSSLVSVSTSSSTFATSKSYFQPNTASTYYIGIKIQSIAGGALLLDNIKVEEVPCWPGANPVISGSSGVCPGSSLVYTATGTGFIGNTTANGLAGRTTTTTLFTWGVPVGWLITGGQGTSSATVTTGISPGNVTATGDVASCDSSLPTNFPVTSASIPGQPSTITASSANYCTLPTAGYVFSVTNAATSYSWSFPTGWTITAGSTTSAVTVTATAGAVSGTITVTPSNGSCQGTPRTLSVSVGSVPNSTCAAATPITTTAADSFRCGVRDYFYAFTPTCTENYKINLSGTGGDIDLYLYSNCTPTTIASSASAANSETITSFLTAGVTYYIRVYEFVTPAGSGGTFRLSVAPTSVGTPTAITGFPSVSCSSITTTTYSVAAVSGATSYTWTVPAGWTINSGQGTTAISITTNGSSAGIMSVVAISACGTSLPASKTITVGQITPGTISGSTGLCSPFTNTTYSITTVSGATSYTWAVPSGWIIVAGQGTLSITVSPSSTNGNISVTATGPCGTSPASTLAVTTAASVTTTGALICAGSSATISATLTTLTTFNLDIPLGAPTFVRPITGTTFISSGTNVIYATQVIVPTVTGAYTFAGCDSGSKDTYLVIYNGTFTPGSPSTNFVAADDDSNGGFAAVCNYDPSITVTLTAGQTYTIVATVYSAATTFVTGNTITVTPPGGGGIQLGVVEWYTAASGGTLIGTGSPFNPVGVAGSGLPNTLTPGTTIFYGTNSLSNYCRTATNFVISAAPIQNITPVTGITICRNSVYAVSANATGTGVTTTWTSNVANTLYSNTLGTIAYVGGTNAATVYVKSNSSVTVTATSFVGTCSVSNSATYSIGGFVTWDGGSSSWSNVTGPTINDAIEITNGWADGDLQGCSCTVTSGTVNFYAGETLTLTNELTVQSGGTVVFEDQSSLYQTGTVANAPGSYSGGNSGNISYSRTAQPMFKFDYTYWSSPVLNQNLYAVATGAPVPFFYRYNYTTQAWQYVNPSFTTMEVGRGYIWRAPIGFPTFPGTPNAFTAIFTGIPNNGTITYPIATGSAQLNLIGNPYPSTVFADDFISATANNNLTGTLYFWTHNTNINASGQYVNADYATYNLLGGVGTGLGSGAGNVAAPSGYIGSGQGFFVKGITGTPSGSPGPYSITFANSMRKAANNDTTNFFKNSQATENTSAIERARFWINISNTTGGFKQTLIGYAENATNGLDRMYDGDFVDVGNPIAIYSLIDNNSLTIQARQWPFENSDLVPLGYKSLTTGNCTISIDHFDTYFTNQDIFIEDMLLGIIHNLKSSPYVFTTDIGTFSDRFVIRYTTDALGSDGSTFNENSVKVYKDEMGLHITTGNVFMKNVKIFDITGRLITSRDNISASETLFTTLPKTQQIVLVKITAETGETLTKKVLF